MDASLYQDEYIAEYNIHRQNLLSQNRFYRHRRENILDIVRPRPGEQIIDLGCGIGTVSFFLAEAGCRVIGLDISRTALTLARQIANECSFKPPFFVVGSVTALPFKKKLTDKIIAADLTEHLDDSTLYGMLRECRDVLKTAGRLGIYTPSPTHIFESIKKRNIFIKPDHSHIGLRTMRVLKKMTIESGFIMVRSFHKTTHIPVFKTIEKILMYLPVMGGGLKRRICLVAEKQ